LSALCFGLDQCRKNVREKDIRKEKRKEGAALEE
jgi:hypothetical protein